MRFIKFMARCAKWYFSVGKQKRKRTRKKNIKYGPGVYAYTIDAAEAWKR